VLTCYYGYYDATAPLSFETRVSLPSPADDHFVPNTHEHFSLLPRGPSRLGSCHANRSFVPYTFPATHSRRAFRP